MPQPPCRTSSIIDSPDFGDVVASQLAQVAQHLVLEHSRSLRAREQNFECTITALRQENARLRHRLCVFESLGDSIPSRRLVAHSDDGAETSDLQLFRLGAEFDEHDANLITTADSEAESSSPNAIVIAVGSPVRTVHSTMAITVGSPVMSPTRRLSVVSPAPSSKKSSPMKRLQFSSGSVYDLFQVWPELMDSPDECHPPTIDFCRDDITHTASMSSALNLSNTIEVAEQSACALCRILVSSPSSRCRLGWEVFGIPLLAYDLTFIPMQVFDIPQNIFTDILSWTSMLYWTCDLVASFFVGYYTNDGKLVLEWCMICKRYLQSSFWLDFAIVSIDWMLLAVDRVSGLEAIGIARMGKLLRLLRIFRVLRLLRLRKLRHLVHCIQDRIDSEYLSVVVNICKNLLCIVMASHFVACLWFFVGSQKFPRSHSWVEVYHLGEGVAWEYKYMTSLHWAICQFTPGSMKVQPQNVIERLFSVLMLLCSLLVFSMFISSLTNAMRTLQSLGSKDARQLWLLRKFFRQNGVSRDLSMRIMRYVNVVLLPQQHRVQQSDIGMLSQLSSHLRVELQTELNMPSLIVHPFFEWFGGKSLPVMRRLCCVATKRTSLSREDVLFGPGQKAVEMYFPLSGQLLYIPQREMQSQMLIAKGEWCCEAVLWCPWVHHGTLRAKVETELLSLSATIFREVVTEHYIDLSYAQSYAAAFVQCLNDATMSAIQVSDLSNDFLKTEALIGVLSS